jgi:hypothetical protein
LRARAAPTTAQSRTTPHGFPNTLAGATKLEIPISALFGGALGGIRNIVSHLVLEFLDSTRVIWGRGFESEVGYAMRFVAAPIVLEDKIRVELQRRVRAAM